MVLQRQFDKERALSTMKQPSVKKVHKETSLSVSTSPRVTQRLQNHSSLTNEQVIKKFIEVVRSGYDPEQAELFMANEITAHQMNSENRMSILRTPKNYADHVKEMKEYFGDFVIEIEEIISQNQKVYIRWKQTGKHIGEYEGYPPTGKEVVEIASAVYRLEDQKIVEYWIQIDRFGMIEQLIENQK